MPYELTHTLKVKRWVYPYSFLASTNNVAAARSNPLLLAVIFTSPGVLPVLSSTVSFMWKVRGQV
ncbi:hypothetical protein [Pontibacter chitinilyticus]|uniref:hypothetical protein n=1 Tax=Pontibacter chitinilyticus TaxID=2674989 RepID=UPI003219B9DB